MADCCCDENDIFDYRSNLDNPCRGREDAPQPPPDEGYYDCGVCPQCFLIDVSGVVDNECTDCDIWNREYVLEVWNISASSICDWVNPHTEDGNCSFSYTNGEGNTINITNMKQAYVRLYVFGGFWTLEFYTSSSGGNIPLALYKKAFVSEPHDCGDIDSQGTGTGTGNTITLTLDFVRDFGGVIPCDWPATIDVFELEECPPEQVTIEEDGSDDCDIDDVKPCGDCPNPCMWEVEFSGVTDGTCSDCDTEYNKLFFLRREGLLCRWDGANCGGGDCDGGDSQLLNLSITDPNPGTGTGSNSTTALFTLTILSGGGTTTVAEYSKEVDMPATCTRGIVLDLDSNDGTCATWPSTATIVASKIPRGENEVCFERDCIDYEDECRTCDCNTPEDLEFTISGVTGSSSGCTSVNSTWTVSKDADDPCLFDTGASPTFPLPEITLKPTDDPIKLTMLNDDGGGTGEFYVEYHADTCSTLDCQTSIVFRYISSTGDCTGWPSTITVSPP
ncbi:hypothetical protein OAG36_00680 [bacterium]|nr:hypothetical protein [bacterium]